MILPLGLIIAGLLLIVGSIGLTTYVFKYESDNAGVLFGMSVMPVAAGLGAILILSGIIMALVRVANQKKQ